MPTGNDEEVVWINLEIAEDLCYRIARQLSEDADEPMPAFRTAQRGRLEASLSAPRSPFEDYDPYPGLEEKAAVLLHRLTKNHPFPNGNKRFATASYLLFLALNGWWPRMSKDELIELVEEVAASDSDAHREVVAEVASLTADRLVPVEQADRAALDFPRRLGRGNISLQ